MVSSDAAGGGAAAIGDCSIGSIVWVRRRNGSWWPGKILGPDELSASHVMSPRSGTPVKLLGREDASVDWYNLEKSKRVKSFRCGEFDDCIERAEATQGMPPKKREKYARREDAILHALALERQALAKKYGKTGPPVNRRNSKSLNSARGQLVVPSQKIGKGLGPSSRRVKHDYELGDEDYNPGITPRMRDLGDFGPKYSPSVSNGSQKTLLLDSAKAHPHDSPRPEDASDGTENSSEKRKRPHEGSGDDSLAKRRERRLPLHHVLENSSKSPSPHLEADGSVNLNLISEDEQPRNSLQHGDVEEDNMGSNEDTETDSSETDSQDSDSDDLASLSEGAAFIELQPKYPRRSEERDEQSISSEEVDELMLENEVSHPGSTMGISRWQHKGKRNVRSLVKKPEGSEKSFSWVSMEEIKASEAGMNGKSLGPQIARFGSRTSQWDWSSQYLDPSYPGRRQYVGKSMFVDVEVKVQSSMGYKKEHVPMISLRSKVTDQAIIGHPLQVEALESSSTDSLLVEINDWYPDMQENDAALTPTWRTARRTASARVPRPSFTSAGDESYRNPHFYDNKRGMLSNSPAKPSRKPQKKISLSGNQKTRTLSSIASQPKKGSDSRRTLQKPEPAMPTAVSCIPVKLVFSRLQEDLFGRHP